MSTPKALKTATGFNPRCVACPRLAAHLGALRVRHPDYFNGPVPPFGPDAAELLIVGLAPGLHGANRTGRPFTGDHAGILLYETLHAYGFANHAGSPDAGDGLELRGCRITNAVKCLPPQNKPEGIEVRQCNSYLAQEIMTQQPRAILALGSVAHHAVLLARGLRARDYPFGHHAVHELPADASGFHGTRLYDSYHCSRYNTQTRRLTPEMFRAVLTDIRAYLRARP